MTAWTCARVGEELDLFAVGECPDPDQAAVASHLESCAECRANLDASRRLHELLDLHTAVPARLDRLQALIRQEARQRRRSTVMTLARRYAALAALLLIGFLALPNAPVPSVPATPRGDTLVVAGVAGEPIDRSMGFAREKPAIAPEGAVQRTTAVASAGPTYPLKTGPAAIVNLRLTLFNKGPGPLTVVPGGDRTEVLLDLIGPAVERTREVGPSARLALEPESLTLQPGQTGVLTLHRLTAGRKGDVMELTWAKSGTYRLSGTLRLEARGGVGGVVTVVLPESGIRVE